MVAVAISHTPQGIDAELGSDDCPDGESGRGRGTQMADPTRDHCSHASRNGDSERRKVRDVAESAFSRQQPHGLPDEQRIASGRTPHGRDPWITPHDVHGPTQVVGDSVDRQPAKRHRARA